MDWVEHAIWWQVYPLGFCGAPIRDPEPTPAPRLRRLTGWLDYAIELGTSGLLLGPVFASQTHGYDTVDPMRVDPRLGTNEDLLALIDAAHTRGVRVMLDGVFNHVGIDHPDFAALPRVGPRSRQAGMFRLTWPGGEDAWRPGTAPDYERFEGQDWLPELDHSCEAVVELVTDVMTHWCSRGVDGWRLDAAYAIDPTFWTRVLPRVRRAHPEVYIVGEVIHGDYAAIVSASGMDAVTQYELWQAIWHSLAEANFYELDWTLGRNAELLRTFVPWTFIGNHDVTRIASAVGPDGAVTALAVLMTVGGIPSIYSGDEQGFTGVKEERAGGDDAVRPAFPASPDGLAPWGWGVYRAHQDLIGLRRRNPWLTTATTSAVALENQRYTYRVRAADSSACLDVSIDLTSTPRATIRDGGGTVLWEQAGH